MFVFGVKIIIKGDVKRKVRLENCFCFVRYLVFVSGLIIEFYLENSDFVGLFKSWML